MCPDGRCEYLREFLANHDAETPHQISISRFEWRCKAQAETKRAEAAESALAALRAERADAKAR